MTGQYDLEDSQSQATHCLWLSEVYILFSNCVFKCRKVQLSEDSLYFQDYLTAKVWWFMFCDPFHIKDTDHESKVKCEACWILCCLLLDGVPLEAVIWASHSYSLLSVTHFFLVPLISYWIFNLTKCLLIWNAVLLHEWQEHGKVLGRAMVP